VASDEKRQTEKGFGAEADELMASIAERLGKGARAAAVFGDPVERDGVTIIPVAKARWGFGGGSGSDGAAAEAEASEAEAQPGAKQRRGRAGRSGRGGTGSGGGGGAMVAPAGFIEIKDGKADFKPVVDASTIAIVGTVAIALVLIVWGLARPFAR